MDYVMGHFTAPPAAGHYLDVGRRKYSSQIWSVACTIHSNNAFQQIFSPCCQNLIFLGRQSKLEFYNLIGHPKISGKMRF